VTTPDEHSKENGDVELSDMNTCGRRIKEGGTFALSGIANSHNKRDANFGHYAQLSSLNSLD
jgi:hypothetical protein